MFLQKKSARAPVKRLKCAVKLDFGAISGDLRGSVNAIKDGNRIVSRFRRREQFLFAEPRQVIGTNGEVIYVLCDDGMYSIRTSTMGWLSDDIASSATSCIYRGDMIISSDEFGTYFVTQNKAQSIYKDGFSSLTVCADRILGLYQNKVRYTAAGERDGFANGETITLPTDCDALVTVDDKVYVLGNTCYTISPKADDIEFKFSYFAKNIGVVSERSVVVYNGRAVFASKSGLYQISSDKITPIFTQLCEAVDFAGSVATWFDGKYYLSCRTKDSSETLNDVTLILDLDSEEIVGVLDIGFESMCANSHTIYVTREGHQYRIVNEVSIGRFVKSKIDFATDKKKFLDRLTVTTRNDLDVAIHSENETRLYKIKGKKTAQKINLRDMGWEFSIELSSVDGLDVENLELYAHVCEEV